MSLAPDRKFAKWREDPSKLRGKVDRFGMSLLFASPKNEIIYNVQGPDGHELAISAVTPRGNVGGISLEEWQKNLYGMREAVQRGLRVRERTTKQRIVLPPPFDY